jgi:hypothetical protein
MGDGGRQRKGWPRVGTQQVEMRQAAMAELPCLEAFVAAIADIRRRRLWQRDLALRLASDGAWRQRAMALDRVLAGIDPVAREALLSVVPGQIDQHNPAQGWGQAFDHLSQARAYRHLAAEGCREITFVPGSYAVKSPDLMAESAAGPVLCEVKTLHFRNHATPADSVRRLALRLKDAAAQLAAVATDGPARRMIYLCLDFPEGAFNSADIARHCAALSASAQQDGPAGIEIVFDCLPAICDTDAR